MGSGAAVFVLGPAGSGKSTFCQHFLNHCAMASRPAHLFNLDPAADTEPDPLPTASPRPQSKYSPSKDIKDLVTIQEVMQEMSLGPNGALLYSLELLLENRSWLDDDLSQYEDEFLVIDCPGQIELYSSHENIFPKIVSIFTENGYRPCVVYLMESQFLQDVSKYFAGVLHCASTMLQLGLPHINVISKMDLLVGCGVDCEDLDEVCEEWHPLHGFFFPDPRMLSEGLQDGMPAKFKALNEALVQLVSEFDVVNFLPLTLREECLEKVMLLIDNATQYSENLEPKEPKNSDLSEEDYDDEDDFVD